MLLNATLLVQCINIGIAYMMLDRFLWKHAVKNIVEDQESERHTAVVLEREQALVKEKELQKVKAWHAMRRRFQEQIPAIGSRHFGKKTIDVRPDQVEHISESQQQALADSMTHWLKDKVSDVH